MNRQALREKMFSVIEEYLVSGQTQAAFCSDHSLAVVKFQYWLRRYRQSENAPMEDAGFIKLQQPGVRSSLEVVFPNGVKVNMGAKADLTVLRKIISCW